MDGMNNMAVQETKIAEDYGIIFKPEKTVYVIKKDGSKEAFNVQKVIDAVGDRKSVV